ncbi:MAG TPA: hypothetical protein VKU19_01215 [Bryobacteraceae bacterium]|nr:hypothetical protein [Bryobacteraceae bacterium]
MALVIGISVITCLAIAMALPLLLRKVPVHFSSLPLTTEWIDELSIERYRPMLRLLDAADLEFLRTQPGFSPKMERKLRAQRCQIFRGYLRCLRGDFERICTTIKVLMLQSRNDRPDLAAALVRHQVTFALGMASVEVRLLLYRWGLGAVDVAVLVRVFEQVRVELRGMLPVAAAAGA